MEDKNKNLKSTILGWTKLRQYGQVEVWKTPTMFLTCNHYMMVFRFTSTLKSAIEEVKNIQKIFKKYLKNLTLQISVKRRFDYG